MLGCCTRRLFVRFWNTAGGLSNYAIRVAIYVVYCRAGRRSCRTIRVRSPCASWAILDWAVAIYSPDLIYLHHSFLRFGLYPYLRWVVGSCPKRRIFRDHFRRIMKLHWLRTRLRSFVWRFTGNNVQCYVRWNFSINFAYASGPRKLANLADCCPSWALIFNMFPSVDSGKTSAEIFLGCSMCVPSFGFPSSFLVALASLISNHPPS